MKLLQKMVTVVIISLLNADEIQVPKWVDPSVESCEANGGIIKDGYCDASFYDAQKICKADGYILPTIEAFKITSEYCTAKPYDEYSNIFTPLQATELRRENSDNEEYAQCVEKLGFDSLFEYVSATKEPDWNWEKIRRKVISHNFSAAHSAKLYYTYKAHVRCIK